MNNITSNREETTEPIFLTVKDLCQRWRVSRETVQRHIKNHQIPHLKLFGGLRFKLTEIVGIESTLGARK
jgi:excisionase family DNA binding protein